MACTSRVATPYFGLWGHNYKFSTAHRGILEVGGALSNETGYYFDTYDGPVVRQIAEAGFPMISPNVSQQWGNDTSMTTMTNCKNYAQANLGFASGKVYLKGGSMGGLECLNWARANPTLVSAIVLTNPVTDLGWFHDNNVLGLASSIETAYGGAAGYATAVDAHNPTLHTTDFQQFPILMFYADDDPVIPKTQALSFAAAVGAQTISLGNVGHTVQGLTMEPITNFLSGYP